MCGDQAIATQWVTVQYKDSELFSQTRIGGSSQLLMWKCFGCRKSEMSMAFCPLSFLPFVFFPLSVCQMPDATEDSWSPSHGRWLSKLGNHEQAWPACRAMGMSTGWNRAWRMVSSISLKYNIKCLKVLPLVKNQRFSFVNMLCFFYVLQDSLWAKICK